MVVERRDKGFGDRLSGSRVSAGGDDDILGLDGGEGARHCEHS